MTAYLGLHQGLLQGAIFATIAFVVIALAALTYRWVSRSESRHIVRGEDEQRTPEGREGGYGDPRSHGA
jgi:hypothetical protein